MVSINIHTINKVKIQITKFRRSFFWSHFTDILDKYEVFSLPLKPGLLYQEPSHLSTSPLLLLLGPWTKKLVNKTKDEAGHWSYLSKGRNQ